MRSRGRPHALGLLAVAAMPLGGAACAAPVEAPFRLFAIEMSLDASAVDTGARSARATARVRRAEAASAVLGDRLFLLGGYGEDGAPSAALEVYDPAADRWERLADWPSPRLFVSLATAHGELCAGHGYADLAARDPVLTIDCYVPGSGVWHTLPVLPQPVASPALAGVGASLYVLGGFDHASATPTTRSARYDFSADAWLALPEASAAFSAERVAALGPMLYVAAATGSDVAFLAFDTAVDTWFMPPQPPGALFGHASFLFAAESSVTLGLADAYPDAGKPGRLLLSTNDWELGRPLPSFGLPTGYAAAAADTGVYVALYDTMQDGGHYAWDQLWLYEAAEDRWTLRSERAHEAAHQAYYVPHVLGGVPHVLGNTLALVPAGRD
ncbi:MAG: hypothetical protein HY908_17395 [Myxococcales bacterium]|nr:hypothetical protein [Myxococcales bacterium]